MSGASSEDKGLRSRCWRLTYKTSSTIIDGRPVDILKDFYIPALQLSARYDRVAGYFPWSWRHATLKRECPFWKI